MACHRHSTPVRLVLEQLEERENPSGSVLSLQSFDTILAPALPSGFSVWTSGSSFTTSAAKSFSANQSLSSDGLSNGVARFWQNSTQPAENGVQATIFADSLVPIQIFARGQNLSGSTPTYYGVTVTRGLQLDLVRVVNGVSTTIATIRSNSYVSGKWVTVNLTFEGDKLLVEAVRADTNQYLNATGNWVSTSATALQVTDTAIAGGGFAGINRQARYAGAAYVDDFAILGPISGPTISESFNSASTGGLPSGWSRWSTDGSLGFGASSTRAIDGLGLQSSGSTTRASRAWDDDALPSNVQATASIYVDSLIPAQIFVRGSDLTTISPDYYAVTVSRGLNVSISKVVNGVSTELATLKSNVYTSGLWIRVSITAQDNKLQARVQRLDTGAWLNNSGDWMSDPAAALDASDSTIAGSGKAGLSRPASYSGNIAFDNFEAGPGTSDITVPSLQVSLPPVSPLTGVVAVSVNTADASGIAKVEYYIDNTLVLTTTASPFNWNLDTRNWGNGTHQLSIRAYDRAGNVAIANLSASFTNAPSYELPSIDQHYSHIRIAALAYSGNPMSTTEISLLRNSIDLVVANPRYLSTINQTSPNTPQLIYSNVSNLYQELLTDWLDYADDRGIARETAFYHVSEVTAFTGGSASSQPVEWFWNVQRGPTSGTTGFRRLVGEARDTAAADVAFAEAGQAIYLGYTDEFREINFNLSSGKQAGWSYVVEYASAIDSSGNVSSWNTLGSITDTTNALSRSGRWTFDPPSDWKASIVIGSTASLYYVRIRTITGTATQAPVATSVLGRDYASAQGGSTGTIPAFDYAADTNNDGYLTDAEYARRATGKDARFVYESRLFYPYYGQMRFVINPGSTAIQNWAADFHERLLAAQPLADGIFMDNSSGKNPVANYDLIESSAAYSAEYSAMLAVINREISPKWVMANTSNGNADTDMVVRQVPATLEEFGIRALAHNWTQFSDLADTVKRRQNLTEPSGYLIIDSLSTGGSPTDARTRMATLAYYYMIGDSQSTMLMLWGGEEPASSWSRHWFNALSYNVAQAQGDYSLFATGSDPGNAALTYKVYQREYDNALVLYKPLSYATGRGNGTTSNNTATIHQLGGSYRVLNSDGTLGATVTSISLRNGEGAVLIKV